MSFNISALDSFRVARLDGENAIANLGEDNTIVKKNDYYGGIGRIFRSSSTKAANNAVRAELLRSLGQAFELDGVSEKDGKLCFSKDFVQRLEKKLGRGILKTEDFKFGKDGSVTSGKPLTQRRIEAIVSKAIKAGGELDVKGYEKKLAVIQKELQGKDKNAVKFYDDVKRALNFYKNEIDRVIIKNENYDPTSNIPIDYDYDHSREPFLMYDYEQMDYVPLKSGGQLRDHLNSDSIKNNPLKMYVHLENALKVTDTVLHDERDFDRLKNYLKEVVRSYVQLSIDCYFAAQDNADAKRAFDGFLYNYNHCLDGRATELNLFAMKYLPTEAPEESNGPAAPEEPEDELKIPADKLPDHTEKTRLDECLYKEIYGVKAALPNAKSWADIAGAIKKRMVGLTRPIATLNNGVPEPLLENGKPVIRPVTAEDIDRLGPACCEITFAFND